MKAAQGISTNLPVEKQKELEQIVEIITEKTSVEKIILFGSHARGDWVSDRYREGHVTYEYQSDYDILVVVASEKLKKNTELWKGVEAAISADPLIKTPVSLLVDTLLFVNRQISEGNYFYLDIKREGMVLYDSGRTDLVEPSELPKEEKLVLAKKDMDFWLSKSAAFYRDYEHNMDDHAYNNAAFHLSQAAEALYFAILLVFKGYKPKSHNLEKLAQLVAELVPETKNAFPSTTDEEKRLFDLLKRAYIDARYKQDYVVNKKDLEYLAAKLRDLEEKVTSACDEYLQA